MNPLHPAVSRRARRRCEFCRTHERLSSSRFEIEHLTPVSRGGTDDMDNLALACRACNGYKGDRRCITDDPPDLGDGLFNPRIMAWDDHFRLDVDSAEIIGVTPIGVHTVAMLQINDPVALSARLFWISLNAYP